MLRSKSASSLVRSYNAFDYECGGSDLLSWSTFFGFHKLTKAFPENDKTILSNSFYFAIMHGNMEVVKDFVNSVTNSAKIESYQVNYFYLKCVL